MRLSISNIAWDVEEDPAVADLLRELGIDAIDIAPGKYFSRPANATDVEIEAVRRAWEDRGISIVGMQALLFGTDGLNLFGPASVQEAMLAHLAAVCRIGAGLGATRLVFGSPRNRDRSGLDDDKALARAIDFFRRLGDIAASRGVVICLEPNPPRYGANFMTCLAETAHVVREVGHPAIRLQFDTGALTLAAESAEDELAKHAELVCHVHASEPDLLPLGDGGTDHRTLGRELSRYLADRVVTVEMLATRDEPHLASIRRALETALDAYGGRGESRS